MSFCLLGLEVLSFCLLGLEVGFCLSEYWGWFGEMSFCLLGLGVDFCLSAYWGWEWGNVFLLDWGWERVNGFLPTGVGSGVLSFC